jgi:hypothetical protein
MLAHRGNEPLGPRTIFENGRLTNLESKSNLLHAAGSACCIGRWSGSHQAQSLQQKNGALGSAPPNQLAAITLAILDIYVAPRIFQAAILENAVDENSLVQDDVLVFKCFVFVPAHG